MYRYALSIVMILRIVIPRARRRFFFPRTTATDIRSARRLVHRNVYVQPTVEPSNFPRVNNRRKYDIEMYIYR